MTTLGISDLVLTIAVKTALSPGSAQWLITKTTVTNTDVSAQTVTVYRVPFGGTAGTGNAVVEPLTLQPGETQALPLSGHAIVASGSLQALASADNVVNMSVTYQVVS